MLLESNNKVRKELGIMSLYHFFPLLHLL